MCVHLSLRPSFPEGLFVHPARVTPFSDLCGGMDEKLKDGVYGSNGDVISYQRQSWNPVLRS